MTLPVYWILLIALAHFFGDFMFQTDAMAINKSRSNLALASHAGTVTVVLGFLAAVAALFSITTLPRAIAWVLFNGTAHFLTDYVTSRITSKLFFFQRHPTFTSLWKPVFENRHNFFVVIGADQLIHMTTLYVSAAWWSV